MRLLPLDEITERVLPFLQEAGVLDPANLADRQLLDQAMPLVGERINKLAEAVPMLDFLFVADADFVRHDELDDAGREVVQAAYDALSAIDVWSTDAIDGALRAKLVEELGLKPRNAFGPVRIAVSGRKISPPLFESLELLGRERSIARLRDALTV